jgi:hypothetical protein
VEEFCCVRNIIDFLFLYSHGSTVLVGLGFLIVEVLRSHSDTPHSVCGRSLAGTAGLNPAGGTDVCLLWVVCVVQVQASATRRSLVQGSPTECVCVCHWVWSGATITIYAYKEHVEDRLKKLKYNEVILLQSSPTHTHTQITKTESNKRHDIALCSENKYSSTHSPPRGSSFPKLHLIFHADHCFAHKKCLPTKF